MKLFKSIFQISISLAILLPSLNSYSFMTFKQKASHDGVSITWDAKLLSDDKSNFVEPATFHIEKCSWATNGRHAKDIRYAIKKWNDIYGMHDRLIAENQDPTCTQPNIDHTDDRNSVAIIVNSDPENASASVRVVDTNGLSYGGEGLDLGGGLTGQISNVDVIVPFFLVNSDRRVDTMDPEKIVNPILVRTGFKSCDRFDQGISTKSYAIFRSTIFHEFGHALGLAHPCEDYPSYMRTNTCNTVEQRPIFCSIDNVRALADDATAGRFLYNADKPNQTYVEQSIATIPYRMSSQDIFPAQIPFITNHQINDTSLFLNTRSYVPPNKSSTPKEVCPGTDIYVEVSTMNLGNVVIDYNRSVFMAPDVSPNVMQTYDNKTTLKDLRNRTKSPNIYQYENIELVTIPNETKPGTYVLGTHIYQINNSDQDINENDNISHNITPVVVLDSSHPNCN